MYATCILFATTLLFLFSRTHSAASPRITYHQYVTLFLLKYDTTMPEYLENDPVVIPPEKIGAYRKLCPIAYKILKECRSLEHISFSGPGPTEDGMVAEADPRTAIVLVSMVIDGHDVGMYYLYDDHSLTIIYKDNIFNGSHREASLELRTCLVNSAIIHPFIKEAVRYLDANGYPGSAMHKVMVNFKDRLPIPSDWIIYVRHYKSVKEKVTVAGIVVRPPNSRSEEVFFGIEKTTNGFCAFPLANSVNVRYVVVPKEAVN